MNKKDIKWIKDTQKELLKAKNSGSAQSGKFNIPAYQEDTKDFILAFEKMLEEINIKFFHVFQYSKTVTCVYW